MVCVCLPNKKKPCLFIWKLIERFLHYKNGPIAAHSIGCLKPPIGSGNVWIYTSAFTSWYSSISISKYVMGDRSIIIEEWQM